MSEIKKCYTDYKSNENYIALYKFRNNIYYRNIPSIGLYKDKQQQTTKLEQLIIKAADYIKPAGSTLEECKSAQQQCNVTAGAICVFTTQENVKDTDRALTLYFMQGVVSLY